MKCNSEQLSWDVMIDAFRQFGGIIENVDRRKGPLGFGLFVIDPNKPYQLYVPEHLLVEVSALVKGHEGLYINPNANIPENYKQWFADYQRLFSWGQEGYQSTIKFETGLKKLPAPAVSKLKQMGLNLERRYQGDWETVITNRFLQTRQLAYNGKRIIMPIIELLNHSSTSSGYDTTRGVRVQGYSTDEIYVNYGPSDPIRRFMGYGFVSDEPIALSHPLSISFDDKTRVNILAQPSKAEIQRLKAPVLRESNQDNIWQLDFVLLGLKSKPSAPRTLFEQSLQGHVLRPNYREMFEQVWRENERNLIDLRQTLENSNSPVINGLKRAIHHQLKAMTHCCA
jgi:hypothetical protein